MCIYLSCSLGLITLWVCNCLPVGQPSAFSSEVLLNCALVPLLSTGNFEAQRQMKCLFVEDMQTQTKSLPL